MFAETGLAAGFFLPGDSLLFVAGLFAADGKFILFGSLSQEINLLILLFSVFLAAVIGDAVGYFTGSKLGPHLFKRPKSLLFKPSHLQKANAFYEKYGGKTIIIARFVPIVRTFAPIVAGAAQMPYRTFVVYNVVGGFLWVFSMILAGYFLGPRLPVPARAPRNRRHRHCPALHHSGRHRDRQGAAREDAHGRRSEESASDAQI